MATLDAATFHRRIGNLLDYWKNTQETEFQGAQGALIAVGASEEAGSYQKCVALQNWLLAYEFPDTILFLSLKDKTLYAYCSQKKVNILLQLNEKSGAKCTVEGFVRTKDEAQNQQVLAKFLEKVQASKTVGIFPKDKYTGAFFEQWEAAYGGIKSEITEVDVSAGFATVLAVKDDMELKTMRTVAKASSTLLASYFVDEMARIVDEEQSITHEKFAEKLEATIFDERMRKKIKFPTELEFDFLDWCYTPIIQSGGKYDLRPSAQSSEDKLKGDTILCSIGLRYKNYCSNVGRTYLIDPSKEQEGNYRFLCELQASLLSEFKDGAVCKDIYAKALAIIHEKKPELEAHFVKNLGFVTGLEFRESSFVVGPKNSKELLKGMSVNFSIGFNNLKEGDQTYALALTDIVLVGDNGATSLTDAQKAFADISFFFKGESDGEEAKSEIEEVRPSRSTILKTKLRAEARDVDMSAEQKRALHQRSLLEQRRLESLQRFSGATPAAEANKQAFRRYESYKKDVMLPKEIRSNKILVDRKNSTILLPVFGYAVPFHINTLKNISKNEEGEYTYLRLNFNTPGQAVKKNEPLPYDDATASFIRSFIFRSTDTWRYNQLFKDISDMKREIQKKETQRKEMEDLVEQDKLIEAKRPVAILTDVNIRPGLEGKKLPGDVQIHTNGLRYVSVRGDQKVDVLFSNVRHFFFQPCDHELYVILHLHLKHPIMVGKKKTKDVQFIREAVEAAFDETSNRRRRHNWGDEDELMAEQEERRRRQKTNKEFKAFAEKISEVTNGVMEADMPVRELGFNGVPVRSSVFLQPTTQCLVQLTDMPFLVLDLNDVEIAYLERIQFNIKNFDIVFVYKDFTKAPLHINSIPMAQVENIKDWLDSMDICFVEGPINLNWSNIMKNVNEDPAGFFEDGGWSQFYSDNEDEGEGSEEESASEFEMSEDEDEESSEESEYSEDDDASAEDSEDMSVGDDEDEEDGEDWDELEAKARREDERRRDAERVKGKRRDEDDAELRPKKKKR